MDILNRLPQRRYEAADDLLAFVSIYDDKERTKAYLKLLRASRSHIQGRVCVESGCGMGIMSEELARLGAAKVYAVEVNPHLYQIAKERLSQYPNVTVVNTDIREFRPREQVDVLVHEHYGQMLYDEELHVLSRLRFRPGMVLPDGGRLRCGTTTLARMKDEVITPTVMRQLGGVLVTGLFDESGLRLRRTCAEWRHSQPLRHTALW